MRYFLVANRIQSVAYLTRFSIFPNSYIQRKEKLPENCKKPIHFQHIRFEHGKLFNIKL